MTRRTLIAASTAAAVGAPAAEQPQSQRSLYEVRIFRLRNGAENQRQRTVAFLRAYAPLVKLAGAGPVAAFSSLIAEDTPYLLAMTAFKGYADMEACQTKLHANPDYLKARAAWYSAGRPYEREEVRLLAAFPGFPVMTPPPTEGRKASRVFEMRTYELESAAAVERKIKMFEVGETAIFVRAGMLPVFFGETVFGPNAPSVVYMLGFDDLAARESTGRISGADPEWKKLGEQFPDVATVPKLSISFLSPLAFSDVR
ncbi:MAG: NIPSNAP family protein [Acidobacteriia bacterium]|nr:NIPSNAP family protein [Terriglobia bacterium]